MRSGLTTGSVEGRVERGGATLPRWEVGRSSAGDVRNDGAGVERRCDGGWLCGRGRERDGMEGQGQG